jgi:signal peptidase I
LVLGEGEYLVLGDNSLRSLDGRYFGPVREENILGKARKLYWPLDRLRTLTVKITLSQVEQ